MEGLDSNFRTVGKELKKKKKKKEREEWSTGVWEGDIQAGTNAKVLRLESRFHVWGAAGGSVGKEGKRTELRDRR